jgi:hypothetical protein
VVSLSPQSLGSQETPPHKRKQRPEGVAPGSERAWYKQPLQCPHAGDAAAHRVVVGARSAQDAEHYSPGLPVPNLSLSLKAAAIGRTGRRGPSQTWCATRAQAVQRASRCVVRVLCLAAVSADPGQPSLRLSRPQPVHDTVHCWVSRHFFASWLRTLMWYSL